MAYVFRKQISDKDKPTIKDLSGCAERYSVSLIATILRWLGYTHRKACVVLSNDGFILWARSSKNAFKDGPQAYYGSTIHHFPNMFMMLGPNTGLGHNSMIYMIESQTNYVVDAIQKMISQNIRSIEVKENIPINL